MEAIERIIVSKDWITLLLLGVVFLLIVSSSIDKKRLQLLFALPFDETYRLNYSQQIWHPFNIVFFIVSNLVLSLFVYIVLEQFSPDIVYFSYAPFWQILSLILAYWLFKYSIGKLIAFLFNSQELQNQAVFIKMSYLFSNNLYLLIFLIFAIYFFDSQVLYLYIMMGLYGLLLAIRYFHFLNLYKRQIAVHLFYFILYLCALEIAPLLIVIKIGINTR